MSVFLGIGLGPIQTGIFLSGAEKGGIKRKVIAEVDNKLKDAINKGGGRVGINIAGKDKIYPEIITGVEVYSPVDEKEIEKLIDAAAEADEIATALPSVKFFPQVAEWLRKGFQKNPDKYRIIYTAENDNHAAEKLQEAIGTNFPNTHYLNTVVGKMSGVVPAADCKARSLLPLSPEADRGHLVEEFNKILISKAPGVENRKVKNLYMKEDLYPFEEAKLYGHNAIHLLLALLGKKEGKAYMSDLKECTKLIEFARTAFINECGSALCKKWAGVDELFTEKGFNAYAEDLLVRMTNPFLTDAIERIARDLDRKLSWNDRVVGTMRVALSQGVKPAHIAYGAVLGSIEHFGDDIEKIRKGLSALWPAPWGSEHDSVFNLISEIYRENHK